MQAIKVPEETPGLWFQLWFHVLVTTVLSVFFHIFSNHSSKVQFSDSYLNLRDSWALLTFKQSYCW